MSTRFDCGPGSLCLFGNCTTDNFISATNVTIETLLVCECDEGYKHDRFGLFYRDCGAPWWADIFFYGAIIIPAGTGLLLTSYHLLRSLCARPPLTAYRQQQSFVGGTSNTPGKRHRNRFLITIFCVCLANLLFASAHWYEGRMGPAALVMHIVAFVVFFAASLFILYTFRTLLVRLTKRPGRSTVFRVTVVTVPLLCTLTIASLLIAAARNVPNSDLDDETVGMFNTLYGSVLAVMALNSVTIGFLMLRELIGLTAFMRGWLAAFQQEISSRRTATQDVRNRSHSAVSQTRTYSYTETHTHTHDRTLSQSFTQFDPNTIGGSSTSLTTASTPPQTVRGEAKTTSALTPFSSSSSSSSSKLSSPPTLPRRPRPVSSTSSKSSKSARNKGSIGSSSSQVSGLGIDDHDDDGQYGTLVVRRSADINSVSSWVKSAKKKGKSAKKKGKSGSNRDTYSSSRQVSEIGDDDDDDSYGQSGTLVFRKSADVDSVTSWDKPADVYPDDADTDNDADYSVGNGGQYNTVVIRKPVKKRGSGQSGASSSESSYNGPSLAMFGLSDKDDEVSDDEYEKKKEEEEEESLKREREDKLPDFNTFLASGPGGGAGKDGRNIAAEMEHEPQEMDFLQLAYLQKFAGRMAFFKGSLQAVLAVTFVSQAAIMIAHFAIGFPLFWIVYTAYWFTFSVLWVPVYRLHMAMNSTQMKSKGRRMHTNFVRSSRQQ